MTYVLIFFVFFIICNEYLVTSIKNVTVISQQSIGDKNHYICWDNRADVIVQLENGDIYAFRHDMIWQLRIHNYHDLIVIDKPVFHTDLFPGLPSDIQLGFTMPRIDHRIQDRHEAIPGMTLFLKPPKYYLYRNRQLYRIELIQYWETGPFVDNRFIATLHNTSLLLVAKQGIIPDGIKMIIGGQVFLFDSDRFPEWIGVFNIESKYKYGLDWLKLRQLIPINPGCLNSGSHYLAIFDYGLNWGQYYCITKIDYQNYGRCKDKLRPLSDAFRCPRKLTMLKSSNAVYQLWKFTYLPFSLIIIGSCGVSTALLVLNAVQLINAWYLFRTFTSANHCSAHEIIYSDNFTHIRMVISWINKLCVRNFGPSKSKSTTKSQSISIDQTDFSSRIDCKSDS